MIALSVIVPVFNDVKYIDAAVQSILNQTFNDLELILVNDGSTDGSAEKCRAYEMLDPRVKVVDQANLGVSAARNAGVKISSGMYVGFVDGDDMIEPDMYLLLVNNALANDADISGCDTKIRQATRTAGLSEEEITSVYKHTDALRLNLNGGFRRGVTNKIYKRSMVAAIPFEGHIYEDILYTCRAFIAAGCTVFSTAQKYNYMVRENSVSMNKFNNKYLETVLVSQKIVEMIKVSDETCLPEAREFDVMANLSLLNLLLLAEQGKYAVAYREVVRKLAEYKTFINRSALVRKKHKYAYLLFSLSRRVYRTCMYMYCMATNSDVINRS